MWETMEPGPFLSNSKEWWSCGTKLRCDDKMWGAHIPVVGGEGHDGGEDGERCEGGSEDVEQGVTGATRCTAGTGHGCVLTWSDLRSSHHHQHEATEATTQQLPYVYYSLQLPVTILQTTNIILSVLDTIILSSPPDHSTLALSYNSL